MTTTTTTATAAITKKDMMSAILKDSDQYTKAKLRKMNIDDVRSIYNEYFPQQQDSLESPPEEITVEPEKTVAKDVIVKETEEKTAEDFIPFCTIPDVFDPSPNSECVTLCLKDNPEEFEKCQKHFDSKPKKAAKKRATTSGSRGVKSKWGHVLNSQAGKIDTAISEAKEPLSLEEIAEFAEARLPRTLAHIKYLSTNHDVRINFTKDRLIYWEELFASEPDDSDISLYKIKRG